ncbi:MAG: hypothetical protein EA379_04845 [Phycisphaerales bacterium]|nr:MAG: hypothetical protein EA379_04845 [Phycisphaerales bacterium]
MSAIDSVNTQSPPSAANAFSGISSEQFVKIMLTELSNQDPLAPNDSQAILQQISSIRSIESDLALKDTLSSMIKQNELATAGGLIGKNVLGMALDGLPIEGPVTSISNTRDGVVLNLTGGWQVKMKDVLQIGDAPTGAAQ